MTVIADRLTDADLWATVGLVAGFDDLSWTARAPSHTGISVSDDGRVRRWIDSTEVSVSVQTARFRTTDGCTVRTTTQRPRVEDAVPYR